MPRPIDVHFWPTPNGHKITIALEEMGLPYDLKPINIGVGDQFKPEFLAISPNNRMPAIVDPDGPGGEPISIFESGAILPYLGRKSGKLYPADERGRVKVDEWLVWQVANLGPIAGQANHFRNYARPIVQDGRYTAYAVNRFTNELERLYGVMEVRLREADYLAGDYSIADVATWPWARNPESRGIVLDRFPHVKAWVEKIGARPAVQKALEMGADLRNRALNLADAGAEADAQRRVLFGQRSRV